MAVDEPIVFQDFVGQSIKTRLFNYALETNQNKDHKTINRAVNRTDKIVEITREAILEALKAESELLVFKQACGESIPTLFVSGILHAIDVIEGQPIVGDE